MNQIDLFCRMHHVEHKLSGEYGYPRTDWPAAYREHLIPIWDSYRSPFGNTGAPERNVMAVLGAATMVPINLHRHLFMIEYQTHHITTGTLNSFSSSVLVDGSPSLLTQYQHDAPEIIYRPEWDTRQHTLSGVDFTSYDQT